MILYIHILLIFVLIPLSKEYKPSDFEFSVTEQNFESNLKRCDDTFSRRLRRGVGGLLISVVMVALIINFWEGDNDLFICTPYYSSVFTTCAAIYSIYLILSTLGSEKSNRDELSAYLEKRKQVMEDSQKRKTQELESLVFQYGQIGEAFHFGSPWMHDGFYCFPETRMFYHKKRAIPYEHVIDVQVSSEQKIITDGTFSATTNVDGAGVAVGSDPMLGVMSASAETSGKSHQTSRIDSTYTVTLYLRDEQDKYFDIVCGKNEQKKAHSIMLTVRDIIESNRQES